MRLFEVLDALVRRDAQAPMIRGKVAIGVRGQGGYRFWSAAFGRVADTAQSDELPTDSDVTLFIDERDTDAILARGQLPAKPQLLYIDGDRKLMLRFLARYTGGMSMIGARLAT